MKQKIKILTEKEEKKEAKIEENHHRLIEETLDIAHEKLELEEFTELEHAKEKDYKYASCTSLILKSPSFFDLTDACSTAPSDCSSVATPDGSSINSMQCQQCYAKNPACQGNGQVSGVSAIAFSVDEMGQAEAIVKGLQDKGLIADINMESTQTNRIYNMNGHITTDPSTVRVEVITSDSKAQSVVSHVTTWK